MLKNGKYSSWFRTPLGEGTGVVTIADGKISGGDIALSYEGSYVDDGKILTATFRTWRHSEGAPPVFGIDDLEITVSGKSPSGKVVSATGFAKQAPDLPFEVTLVRMDD
jgi:hypothetical protein